MGLLENVVLVFVAGLVTALATGLGALPFFLFEEIGDRWNVVLWGLASGIMLSASGFGLINEGLAQGTVLELGVGMLLGVALVVVSERLLDAVDLDVGAESEADSVAPDGGVEPAEGGDEGRHEHAADDHGHGHDDDHGHGHDEGDGHGHDEDRLTAEAIARGDLRTLVLILGVLTVHSFPEGVAIGVSFAKLGFEGGLSLLGFSVPLLAVFMTVAISIHNVPEGVAISIPLRAMGVGEWRMVGWAVFSSLPQPVGAVIAFVFVRWARAFMPYGFGFAAGAMIYLVLAEFIPEGLETGAALPRRGYPEMAGGLLVGVLGMLPLLFV